MEKRRLLSNRDKVKKLDFYLDNGLMGLKVSLILLIIITGLLIVFFSILMGNLNQVGRFIFKLPGEEDYLAIFAGIILFIAVPFTIGVKIGLRKKIK